VGNVKVRGFKPIKIEDKGFSLKDKSKIYSITFSRKHETRERKKQGGKR